MSEYLRAPLVSQLVHILQMHYTTMSSFMSTTVNAFVCKHCNQVCPQFSFSKNKVDSLCRTMRFLLGLIVAIVLSLLPSFLEMRVLM